MKQLQQNPKARVTATPGHVDETVEQKARIRQQWFNQIKRVVIFYTSCDVSLPLRVFRQFEKELFLHFWCGTHSQLRTQIHRRLPQLSGSIRQVSPANGNRVEFCSEWNQFTRNIDHGGRSVFRQNTQVNSLSEIVQLLIKLEVDINKKDSHKLIKDLKKNYLL